MENNQILEENKTNVDENPNSSKFIIPMNNEDENLTDEEQKFLDKLEEKYKDRDDYKDNPIIEETSDIVINNDNGCHIIVDENTGSSVKSIGDGSGDIVEEIMRKGTSELSELPATEKIENELRDIYDLSDEDIFKMINILNRLQNKEKISVYNNMPEKMQNLVLAAMGSNNIPPTMENRNIVAKALIEDVLGDIKNDESFIELNEAIKEIAKIPSIIDFHAENYQDIMENKLIQIAEECKDTKPEVSASLMAISNAWKDTYTFVRQNTILDTSERARNRVIKNTEYYNKYIESFNWKAEKSKYIINDMNLVTRALHTYFGDEYTDEVYKAFTILLCNACDNLDFNKPDEVSFIYYSIKNIISLEFVNKEKLLSFNELLVNNIKTLLDRIVSLDIANKERLANRPKTKKEKRHERNNNKKN